MIYRTLGQTGIFVSAISMGCWPIVGDAIWGPQDKAEAIAALKTAVDLGINFFDSAEAYGNGYSEELLSEAFSAMRDKVIIASKVSPAHHDAVQLRAACEASLKRLRTDYIDVYYLHWPSRSVPFAETMDAMRRLQQEGKIRVIAGSNFGIQDFTEIMRYGRIEVNELAFSLLFRAIEDEILPACQKHQVSVTAYMPLMQGLLAGKFHSPSDVPDTRARTRHFSSARSMTRHGEAGAEDETFAAIQKVREIADGIGVPMAHVALAWVLHKPVTSAIVGVRNPDQARANAAAADVRLSPETIRALDEATEPLKQKLGHNLDMWQSGENSRCR